MWSIHILSYLNLSFLLVFSDDRVTCHTGVDDNPFVNGEASRESECKTREI